MAVSLTKRETAFVYRLREKGFAVVVFNSEELGSADAGDVEDRLVEIANNDVIPLLQ